MKKLREMLDDYKNGRIGEDEALDLLRRLPYEDLEFARVDHHRGLRRGFPEVIYGESKPADQIVAIMRSMMTFGGNILVTRVSPEKAEVVTRSIDGVIHHPVARALVLRQEPPPSLPPDGVVQVICAGSSDLPVAEEAAVTAENMGSVVERFYDVGVAGLHRLLGILEDLRRGSVYVVVAGMEGALPSVVAGLVDRPVIAVPTSVGYGAGFGGLAALLGMLNSCSPGISVVNIDNGFGAGYMAGLIHRCCVEGSASRDQHAGRHEKAAGR
jgi:NCAIR mutase (PurE)-related protein